MSDPVSSPAKDERMAKIEFSAKCWAAMKGKGWTFVTLPKDASVKLGTKSRASVKGTINGFAFRSSAFPDGKGSHQIMVNGSMRAGAKIEQDQTAKFVLESDSAPVKVTLPADLKSAFARSAKAKALWAEITPKAKAEWADWVTSAKQEETRVRRIEKTIQRLAAGDRRPSD